MRAALVAMREGKLRSVRTGVSKSCTMARGPSMRTTGSRGKTTEPGGGGGGGGFDNGGGIPSGKEETRTLEQLTEESHSKKGGLSMVRSVLRKSICSGVKWKSLMNEMISPMPAKSYDASGMRSG